jgi:hypothetical protein
MERSPFSTRDDLVWSTDLAKPRLPCLAAAFRDKRNAMMLPQWADPSSLVPDAKRNRTSLACAMSHQVMGLNRQTIGHRRKWFQLTVVYFALGLSGGDPAHQAGIPFERPD